MSENTLPTQEGFYWAAQSRYEWYNLIVHVGGQPPFLYIKDIIDRAGIVSPLSPLKVSDIARWGPRIPYPEPELENEK